MKNKQASMTYNFTVRVLFPGCYVWVQNNSILAFCGYIMQITVDIQTDYIPRELLWMPRLRQSILQWLVLKGLLVNRATLFMWYYTSCTLISSDLIGQSAGHQFRMSHGNVVSYQSILEFEIRKWDIRYK